MRAWLMLKTSELGCYCNQGYCTLQGVTCSHDEDNPCIIKEMDV